MKRLLQQQEETHKRGPDLSLFVSLSLVATDYRGKQNLMNSFINVMKSECTCADVGITSWSRVLVLMVFTRTHIKLDFHTPVCLININIQVSDYGILFVQAPVIYFVFLLIIQTPKQLRLLLQAEHFQMPTPHSRDPLHFKRRGDEDLEVKHKLKEHFYASVCFFSCFFATSTSKKTKKKK